MRYSGTDSPILSDYLPQKTYLKIVLSGGDADTNAAVAGAILGAKFGICHIPDEWKDGLLYASMLHNKVQEFYAMLR